ncbi:CheF family chemotaxis protein [Halorientalis marina]|jgi:helix-turn-helix protein|uniref:CheF family chemotaxis protein n=1 Tax=Halorientalis marina TaxID=2931976 RepID=UPI001FF55DBE|nr:CheF family chemotaxis protein [Halorientalis marina]
MGEGETKLADTQGKFAQVVKDGRKLNDIEWQSGRIILSNKRLILISNDGKRAIPLSDLDGLKGRMDVNQAVARVSGYLSLQLGKDVMLVAPNETEQFKTRLYSALLDQQIILAKHPAVEGGVVQDTGWQKGRLKIGDETVDLAISDGQFVEIELDDIGGVEQDERTVMDEQRTVLEVEHTEDEGTSVQTYLSGTARTCAFLGSLLREGEQRAEVEADLSEREREVLMALYSGVSPFEIPSFVGMDVEKVEEVYDRLIELEILEEVRTRKEVTLKARGRNIASEAIDER